MSAPPQKGNFFQTLLIFAVIFLGINLWMNSSRSNDTRKASEVFEAMVKMNKELRANDIASDQMLYDTKIQDELKREGKPQAEIDKQRLKAVVLMADTKLKYGVQRNDTGSIDLAYTTLLSRLKTYESKPEWNEPVTVAPTEQFPATQVSAAQLYTEAGKALNSRYKNDLILGFIPGYQFIDALVAATGRVPAFSYFFAALLLAIVVRAAVWPFAQRQLMWSRQMSQLQPMVKELQESYAKKDPSGAYRTSPEFQQRMMGLYKEYGINPAGGCLPMLVQLPLFLIVYQCMLHYRFEFQNGTFLWINPATSASSNGFFAPNLGQLDFVLIVIYGISMALSTYLAPVSDPSQAKTQRLIGVGMSVFITIMMFFWPLPSAFVLYWIFLNILSTVQSLRAYRMPAPTLTKVNAPGGAVFPTNGSVNGNGSAVAPNGLFGKTGTPKVQKPKPKKKG